MRTTWIRPSVTLDPLKSTGSGRAPVPLPRTKFSESAPTGNSTQEGSPQEQRDKEPSDLRNGTKTVITESLSDQGKLPDISGKRDSEKNASDTPAISSEEMPTSPPPKPPRTFTYVSPEKLPTASSAVRTPPEPPKNPKPTRPRSVQQPLILSTSQQIPPTGRNRPSPGNEEDTTSVSGIVSGNHQLPNASSAANIVTTSPQPLLSSTPTTTTEQRSLSRRGNHRRLGTLVLPPVPSVPPPPPPQRRPQQSSRNSSAASGHRDAQPESRQDATAMARRKVESPIDGTVVSPEEFECCCKEVFRRGKKAKTHMENGRYAEAANEYQQALSVVDRVLKTQVLNIATDEGTRQKFFQMQAAVFVSRKEALNGFSDAQAAVATPRDMAMTSSTPGAPPTYEDVLREDQRRSTDRRPVVRPPPVPPTRPAPQRRQPHSFEAHNQQPQPRYPQDQSVRCRESRGAQPSLQGNPSGPRSQSTSQRNGPKMQRAPFIRSITHPSNEPLFRPLSTSLQHQDPSHRRSLSLTDDNSRIEMLVDLSEARQVSQPSPSATLGPSELRSTVPKRTSSSRPKSYYPSSDGQSVQSQTRRPRPKSCFQPGDLLSLQIPDDSPEAQKNIVEPQQRLSQSEANLNEVDKTSQTKGQSEDNRAGQGTESFLNSSQKEEVVCQPDSMSLEASSKTISASASLRDPFAGIDPFAATRPSHDDDSYSFSEEFSSISIEDNKCTDTNMTTDTQRGLDKPNLHKKVDRLLTPLKPLRATTNHLVSQKVETPTTDHISAEKELSSLSGEGMGESLLEALDFATCQTPSHTSVSPQRSKGSMKASRCKSEDTLLDCSYNTLGMYLQSTNICASRASIIDEFDPLSTQTENQSDSEPESQKLVPDGDGESAPDEIAEDIEDEPYYAEPRKLLREIEETSLGENDVFEAKASVTSEPYSSGYTSQLSSEGKTIKSPASSSVGSRPSWSSSSPPVVSPVSAESWTSWEREHAATGVGRSKFYSPPADVQHGPQVVPSARASAVSSSYGFVPRTFLPPPESSFRELLRIREGVKIFFIHDDGIVTSPWNRPYLSLIKDTEKAWLSGEGLTLRVGDCLWSAALNKKSTLVLRTETGVYLFQETGQKPECRAVGVRVPATIRRAQQELFARMLQENSRLEDERPSGITKAISKSASTAASKMEKMAMSKSETVTNPPFVRRNSIRALKGVSRKLHALVERTGYAPEELPADYTNLEEASNVLRLARNCKTIQYI